MTQLFRIHPENPQIRLLRQAIDILDEGGIIAFPTDSSYALGCRIGDKHASQRIREIRNLPEEHNFTLICSDLSELSSYARISKNVFKLMREYTPGPYTFILPATKEVPRRLQHPKRRTIGVRIPDHPVIRTFLEELHDVVMSVTLILPGEIAPIDTAEEIYTRLNRKVDVILDAGYCCNEPTSVIDFSSDPNGVPYIVRSGKGNINPFIPQDQKSLSKSSFSQIFEKLK